MNRQRLIRSVGIWVLLGWLSVWANLVSAADPKVTHRLFKRSPQIEETRHFTGLEKIFLSIRLMPVPRGENLIAVEWYAPRGTLKEESSLWVSGDGETTKHIEFWLQLHKTNTFKRLMLDQTFDTELVGRWQVVVRMNDTVVVKDYFDVG